jgi:hypothetical protein
MAICSPLVGIPKDCGDNNLGAIKRALIGSFEDVTGLTVTATSAPDTDGEVTAITRTVGTKFEDFPLTKDTSMFSQDWSGDLVADTHSYTQNVELGFRRIDLRKRNAISLLAAGRRDLIAVVQDNNDDYWMLGSDQGLRLSANSAATNNTRAAGQQMPVTLTSENERHMLYKVDADIVEALLVAAV